MYLHLGQDTVVKMSEVVGTFILCKDHKENTIVYISQISSSTLLKRTKYMNDISNV